MITLGRRGLLSSSFCRSLSNFKSSLALGNLYPNSSLSITAPVKIPEHELFNGYIPIDKLEITCSRSSGPGGQHINKTNSKVDVRFHVKSAEWLSEAIRNNILEKFQNKINKDGYLIVRSDKTRSQLYNQADAMTILRELIRDACKPPPPGPSEESIHLLRKRKEQANRTRLMLKKKESLIKQSRRDQFVL